MTNRIIKRVFTHKSKLLLTLLCILGLVFSYSCNCRNNSTAPDDGQPGPGSGDKTFKASIVGTPQDTLRVNNAGKKKDGTSDITIQFKAQKGIDEVNFAVSIDKVETEDAELDFSLQDGETYEKYMTYDKTSSILTLTSSALEKVKALNSAATPQNKKVSIVFKIDADANGVGYITNQFHLIKIKNIEENEIEGILNKTDAKAHHGFSDKTDILNIKTAAFDVNSGKYATGVYTINNTVTSDKMTKFAPADINEINTYAEYYPAQLDEISKLTKTGEEGEVGVADYYQLNFDITWGDDFESTISSIKFKYQL